MKYIVPLPFFLLLLCRALNADTIYLKEGQETKGVVVEDYHDRIMLSTESGETCYLKKDIEKIKYDTPEDNLVKIGAMYKDKGDYKTALYYYDAAYKLNPSMKEAQDGTLLLINLITQKRESDLEAQVNLKQDTEEKMGKVIAEEISPPSSAIKAKELQAKVGLSIKTLNSEIVVDKVLKNSPADTAGLKEKDVIISIWGKLLRYMQLKDVYNLFLGNTVSELKIMVARDIALTVRKNRIFRGAEDMIGGKLSMEFEGLTIKRVVPAGSLEKAGILEGDMVTKIRGYSTRYISIEAAYKLIEETKGNALKFEIQREFVVWKRG